MAYKKIGIANLMPGSEAWWHEQSAVNHPERSVAPIAVQAPDDVKRQQFADIRQPNPMMPTRTRGGGYRQPGMSEGELADFQAQGNGDVVDLTGPNEMSKGQAQKISKQRAAGVLPEQKPVVTHTQRTDVDETKANPENVEALQEELGLDGGNTVATREPDPGVGGYDDILALMKANALSEGDMARRQHSREIVTGLGDLVSSIANMWATTKGAPNAYDNAKGMTATSQSLYDRELARRKAQNENILNYYRVKKAAEDDAENREYRRQMIAIREQEANRRQTESDAKIKREDDVAQARANLYKAQEDKANADTVEKKGKNQYAVTYWKSYSQYRLTMDHEAADRLANIDAAEAEQEMLNAEQQRKEAESTAKVNKLNRTGGNKSGNKSNKSTSKKKKKQSSLYGGKKKLY